MTDKHTYKRLHLPSGREYVGEFNASHSFVFEDPKAHPAPLLDRTKTNLINNWNNQCPDTWRYWL